MMNLKVDEANFKSERAVVEEEYRQRVLASPYGRLFNALSSASYLEHPYKRPGIGSIEDLEAATLDDVVAFHSAPLPARQRHARRRRRLRPEAARRLDRQVLRAGAATARRRCRASTRASRRGRPIASPQVTGPQVPLPAVALTWLAPPVTQRRRAGAAGRRARCSRQASRRASTSRSSTASASRRRPASTPTCAPAPACSSPTRSPPAASRPPTSSAALLAEVDAARERAAERGRARQGQDPARHPGAACRARRRSASPRRSPRPRCSRATRHASTPTSTSCSASPPPTCSASCASTCSARTR